MHDKRKRGLSKRDTCGWPKGLSHCLSQIRWRSASKSFSPLFSSCLGADFHHSYGYQGPSLFWDYSHCCIPDKRGSFLCCLLWTNFSSYHKRRHNLDISTSCCLCWSCLYIYLQWASWQQMRCELWKKYIVSWDFNLPWDICLQTSACLCNLASCRTISVL